MVPGTGCQEIKSEDGTHHYRSLPITTQDTLKTVALFVAVFINM